MSEEKVCENEQFGVRSRAKLPSPLVQVNEIIIGEKEDAQKILNNKI